MTDPGETRTDPIELRTAPNLSALYAKGVASTLVRRGNADLPETEYVLRDVAVDRVRLARYNRLCGFGVRDDLPLTYPHVLAFGMAMKLMTDPGFPYPLVGLVHIANTIEQKQPILITDSLTHHVRLGNSRPHPKGRQFDVFTEISVGGKTVWSETSTYLRRGESDEGSKSDRSGEFDRSGESDTGAGAHRDATSHGIPQTESAGGRDLADTPTATWKLPADLGRRYAEISGDRNPIHLHPLTAKAFGFPRAIAHGMWSQARCLAAFEGRLPDSCRVEVEFRKPVLLPSTVDFAERRRDGGGREFTLGSADSGKLQLLGSVTER